MSVRSFYQQLPKRSVACPVCHGGSFETLCQTDRYLMGITTVRCEGCGLIMTNPLPTPEALDVFYQDHYRQFYRKLARPNRSYIRRYALHKRANHTSDYLAATGLLAPNRRVLDVGGGEGSILREIRHRYPDAEVVGVEHDDEFRQFAAQYIGRPIYTNLADLPEKERRPFDTIILSHVLEHVFDPVGLMRELAAHLADNGALFIDVPDVCNYHWLADLHIAHLFHFSARTLMRTAHKAGLKVSAIRYHQPPKLPHCLSVVLRKSGAEIQLPDTIENQEAEACQRIRSFGRRAWLFNKVFGITMASYEMGWNIFERLRPTSRLPVPVSIPLQNF